MKESSTKESSLIKLLFIISLLVVASCSSMKEMIKSPKVDLSQVRISNLAGSYADLEIMLAVFNPNTMDFDVSNLKYALDINSKSITSGTMKEKILVKGLQKTYVNVPIRVAYKDLVSSVMMFLKAEALPYKVKGSAEIGPFTVPFDSTGNLLLNDL
jgi:LEA14-like dessication related protein